MEAEIVQLSTRDLLLIAATVITVIDAFLAGYLRDLEEKIREKIVPSLLQKNKWAMGNEEQARGIKEQARGIRTKYRQLWLAFFLFAIAAWLGFAAFIFDSIQRIGRNPCDVWSYFWVILGVLMIVGWSLMMRLSISFDDYLDPGHISTCC